MIKNRADYYFFFQVKIVHVIINWGVSIDLQSGHAKLLEFGLVGLTSSGIYLDDLLID